MDNDPVKTALSRRDYVLLGVYCLLLFGLSLVSGRPLTMHEGVLPETSREMAQDHDWIIPKNGGHPWMENPPLPQWITVGIGVLCGGCDRVWVVRIGPALVSLLSVLLVARMASVWFGRHVGILSGLVLATTYEFLQYAWLAEDEIFLCALCTLAVDAFVRAEFIRGDSAALGNRNPFGARPWSLIWLCVALGLTNWAKGILFGAVMAGAPMVGYLLWNRDLGRIRFYFWFWGALIFLVLMAAWPLAAISKMPDAIDVWKYDHVGRLDGSYTEITQPWWYYLKVLPGNLAPWTLVLPFAFYLTAGQASKVRYSAERFLWCWAILPIAIFSLSPGKHHHYLLQCTAPWSILAARALPWIHEKIQSWPARMRHPRNSLLTLVIPGEIVLAVVAKRIVGPAWMVPALFVAWPCIALGVSWATAHRRGAVAAAGLMTAVTLGFVGGHLYAANYADQCIADTFFLKAIPDQVPAGAPILVNSDTHGMDECRIQFYLGSRAKGLHNLTFLADDQLASTVYVVARAGQEGELSDYGESETLAQSIRSRREKSPADRLTLFRVRLRDDLPRFSTAGIRVSPLQSARRAPGPFLGRATESTVVR
jgi:4-amino-4-deoxy-L-arabinose transferase-like glycosyltransferase